jgi:hypothetical protein
MRGGLLSAGSAQREEMLLRGGDLEKADLFSGRAKVRVRSQAAMNHRSLRAEGTLWLSINRDQREHLGFLSR